MAEFSGSGKSMKRLTTSNESKKRQGFSHKVEPVVVDFSRPPPALGMTRKIIPKDQTDNDSPSSSLTAKN
jgi:hypothetical protein